jgi:hypothetical protein
MVGVRLLFKRPSLSGVSIKERSFEGPTRNMFNMYVLFVGPPSETVAFDLDASTAFSSSCRGGGLA